MPSAEILVMWDGEVLFYIALRYTYIRRSRFKRAVNMLMKHYDTTDIVFVFLLFHMYLHRVLY